MAVNKSLVLSAALAAALLGCGVRPVSATPINPRNADQQVAAIARLHALVQQDQALNAQIAQAQRVYGPDNPRLRALLAQRQAVQKALKSLPLVILKNPPPFTFQPSIPEAPPSSQEIIRRSRVSLLSD